MPLLSGSVTITRLAIVESKAPALFDSIETMRRNVNERRFLPVLNSADALTSCGWVAVDRPFDDAPEIEFMFGDRIVLGFREDTIKIPRPLLKREAQKRIEKIIAEEGKNPDDIGRAFVKAVEAAIVAELRQKIPAKTKIVEVEIPCDGAGNVRVFGKGTIIERVQALTERTFALSLQQRSPTVAARETAGDAVDNFAPFHLA